MVLHVLDFPDIDPVAFSIFGWDIHWYAITYLIGFGLAYVLLRQRLKHEPFRSIRDPKPYTVDDVEGLLFHAIVGVLLGGRLGYVLFYQFEHYLQNPLEIITGIRTGGMSFHGGAIGVILAIAIYCWRNNRPFLQMGDFLAPAVPIGLMFGRIGNFINGELWGREASADLPWAMVFPTGGDVPRHPSQIYQALLEGLLFFILLWLYARKPRFRGQVAAAFLIGYGFFRFIVEYWREPDSHLGLMALGMSMGQWLSWPMILIGVILWINAQNKKICDVNTDPVEVDDAEDETSADPAEGAEKDETVSDRDITFPNDQPVDNPVESDADPKQPVVDEDRPASQ